MTTANFQRSDSLDLNVWAQLHWLDARLDNPRAYPETCGLPRVGGCFLPEEDRWVCIEWARDFHPRSMRRQALALLLDDRGG